MPVKLYNQIKRLKRQALLLAVLALIAFVCGIGFEPNNALWGIPILAGFCGSQMASADVDRLRRQINRSYGSDEEEYF